MGRPAFLVLLWFPDGCILVLHFLVFGFLRKLRFYFAWSCIVWRIVGMWDVDFVTRAVVIVSSPFPLDSLSTLRAEATWCATGPLR